MRKLEISIHALRKESDKAMANYRRGIAKFQSTLSVRRATFTRAPMRRRKEISIHALRKESDLGGLRRR